MFAILRALTKRFGKHDGDYAWISLFGFELQYTYSWNSGDEFLTLMYREDIVFDIRKETK